VVEQARSWIKENSTLVLFLVAQLIALGAAAAAILAYAVKLEQRVMTMETRGAEYTVARMEEMKQRITIIEQRQGRNEQQIERIVTLLTRDLGRTPPP
jgi:archaellum component FlaG (FlaF/FlaG flagellin family)